MSSGVRNIVLGVAQIDGSDPHLPAAIQLAEELDAKLYVVHAYHLPDPLLYPYPEMSVFHPARLEQIREEVQSKLEAQVRSLTASDRVVCRSVPVPADTALVETALDVDADLIIVGATRRSRVGRIMLGTTAQRVVRFARTPVLVRHTAERFRARRVLLTTDLSELNGQMTDRALELVRAISGDTPLRLRALLVVEHDPGLYPALPEDMLNGVGEMRLSAFLDKGSELRRGVEGVVRVGKVRDEIIAEATDWPADLLVAGTHGRRGASRLFIGSVAEALLRGTTCDMLVIPASAVSVTDELEGPRESRVGNRSRGSTAKRELEGKP